MLKPLLHHSTGFKRWKGSASRNQQKQAPPKRSSTWIRSGCASESFAVSMCFCSASLSTGLTHLTPATAGGRSLKRLTYSRTEWNDWKTSCDVYTILPVVMLHLKVWKCYVQELILLRFILKYDIGNRFEGLVDNDQRRAGSSHTLLQRYLSGNQVQCKGIATKSLLKKQRQDYLRLSNQANAANFTLKVAPETTSFKQIHNKARQSWAGQWSIRPSAPLVSNRNKF